ncbi:hybrid sensor histidine kinase/response regulator [Pseudotabrizicola algicola]|uniref:histidine kinase n=1 Tax=Pseudotabrizicola algicola TaxID=2709381 RepID=A0A6B3RFV0_9RHOB|nr:ATP-binding protein [Pseudotabrizicola algicola]NEX44974.1 response regulator [Pseudotabrizicola algicola]
MRGLASRSRLLLAAALAALVAAGFATDPSVRIAAGVVALTLGALVGLLWGALFLAERSDRLAERALVLLVGQDATPCFTTDAQGQILYRNAAAQARFGLAVATLMAALQDHFASPASVLYRLQARAATSGAAREDVVTRRGHSRLAVHRVADGRFLWRLEEFVDRGAAGRGAEGLSLPMLIVNKAGVVLFTNEAMRRLLGGRPRRLDRVFSTQVLRNGEELEVASIDGPVRAILAEIPGVGERREIYLMPVDNRPSGEQIMENFEGLPVALLRFDAEGRLQAANRAARDVLDLGPDARPMFHDVYEGLGRSVLDWLGDVVAERHAGGSEVLRARLGQPDAFHQVTLRRHVDHGRPGVLAVVQDATAMKLREAQFVQSQKMQAIGQLAGGIAHDFNNLLTAISGHCDLLLLRHTREDKDFADLVQINQNANRAAALVGQLLAFSRKQTLKPERIDLQEALSEMAHLLNRLVGEKVRLRLAHAHDLGMIRADKRQLEQVLMNLVVNARDAMAEGGTIRVETEALTLHDEMRRDRAVVPAGEYAAIRVIDTGIGIPPERLDKIFEPFFTTKRAGEGTGLGLSTVYGIVKQSGGFIFVDSTPGEGSVFHLYFPIHIAGEEDEDAPAPEPARKIVLKQGEGVVLLVEDEAPVRAFASRALRLRGYTVLEADCAEEALRLLEDATLQIDVFVTDVVMPGMDGPSWVKLAREARPDVRVVFMSGYAEDCLSEEQGRVPNSVFLAKPFSLNDLAVTVQGQLN